MSIKFINSQISAVPAGMVNPNLEIDAVTLPYIYFVLTGTLSIYALDILRDYILAHRDNCIRHYVAGPLDARSMCAIGGAGI
jgi:hypothetical protein